MNLSKKTVLITGANRGIGQALVTEALNRGAERVYAGTRKPMIHPDRRVIPVIMDITDAAQIQRAAANIGSLDIVLNNAGLSVFDDLSDRSAIEQHLAVNLYGPYGVATAFLPMLAVSKGALVNILSLSSLASVPMYPAYSISKAAALSLTQSLRTLWAARGVRVHGVFPGPVDTDMVRDLDLPKASPESVASAIFDGVERGEEEIFPDTMSAPIADGWRNSISKGLERQFAAYMQETPANVA
jgi:NAD(P)-dependent dehydrogenase (short-subunit alcohol dehydrogenase family)